ncbi:MAG: pantoate--beta-alanine ligase [Gammaproteobacteria bacterium]
MKKITDIKSLREQTRIWRKDDESIALVPTMGNLHKGHISLVELASQHAEHVVVSVFVNPTQFAPGEDYEDYPRTLEADAARLRRAGVDVLFLPESSEIYASGEAQATVVAVPELSAVLCGASREGHFDGVTSVVLRLLNIVGPDIAVFGQKDYQQLLIVRRMVADLHLPVEILAAPTGREKSGLAMSSRNQYLNEKQLKIAPEIYAALSRCAERLNENKESYAGLESLGEKELRAADIDVEYFAIRKAVDLSVPEPDASSLVVLTAGRLGEARLIDNVLLKR